MGTSSATQKSLKKPTTLARPKSAAGWVGRFREIRGGVAGVFVDDSDQNTEAVLYIYFRVALVHLQGSKKDLFSVMSLSFFHRVLTHLLVMNDDGFSMGLLSFIQSDPAFRELVIGE